MLSIMRIVWKSMCGRLASSLQFYFCLLGRSTIRCPLSPGRRSAPAPTPSQHHRDIVGGVGDNIFSLQSKLFFLRELSEKIFDLITVAQVRRLQPLIHRFATTIQRRFPLAANTSAASRCRSRDGKNYVQSVESFL